MSINLTKWRRKKWSKVMIGLYHLHNLFDKQVKQFFGYASFFAALLIQLISYFGFNQPLSKPSIISSAIILGLWLIIWVGLKEFRKCLALHTGAPVMIDKDNSALVKGKDGKLSLALSTEVKGWKPPINKQMVWANSTNVAFANTLHKNAHNRTLWAYVIDDIEKRNDAHVIRNDRSIYFIFNDSPNSSIGYTHVVPVNLNTWLQFKSGALKTADIQASYIPSYLEKFTDAEPYGLIILSLVMSKLDREGRTKIQQQYYQGRIVTCALAHHLHEYCQREFKHTKSIPVMFQSGNPDVKDFIKPFKKNPTEYSKEKVEIFCFDLENPEAHPLPKCCVLNEGGMVSLIQLPALASRYV